MSNKRVKKVAKATRKPVKKVAKKATKKRAAKPQNVVAQATQALAVVDYQKMLTPEMEKGDYSVIATQLKQVQIAEIMKPTPEHLIKNRPAKGGGSWRYIEGWTAKQDLNRIFGFLWSFNIISKERDGDFIIVHGRLTIKHPKTLLPLVEKEQFGGSEIKYVTEKKRQGNKTIRVKTDKPLDIGNEYKTAATDALKKCCAEMGMYWDVYGSNEPIESGNFHEGEVIDVTPQATYVPPTAAPSKPKFVPSTPEQLAALVTRAVNQAKTSGELEDLLGKIEASTKLTPNFKKSMRTAISNKMDVLDNK